MRIGGSLLAVCFVFGAPAGAQDAGKARMFARGVYQVIFGEGRDVTSEDLARIAGQLGYDPGDLARGMQEPAVKERLKAEVDTAIARGVFG